MPRCWTAARSGNSCTLPAGGSIADAETRCLFLPGVPLTFKALSHFGGKLLEGGAHVDLLVLPGRAAQLEKHCLVVKTQDGEIRRRVKTKIGLKQSKASSRLADVTGILRRQPPQDQYHIRSWSESDTARTFCVSLNRTGPSCPTARRCVGRCRLARFQSLALQGRALVSVPLVTSRAHAPSKQQMALCARAKLRQQLLRCPRASRYQVTRRREFPARSDGSPDLHVHRTDVAKPTSAMLREILSAMA
jgi:hypothetical protein